MNARWIQAMLLMLATVGSVPGIGAQTLEGRIEEQDFRIRRQRPMTPSTQAQAPPLAPQPAAPLLGSANSGATQAIVPLSDFAAPPPKNFDIGAERGSKEMVLAWERWHKQLAQAIYTLWDRRAKTPGRATLRITVYRNRTIVPEILEASAGPEFKRTLMGVFDDLDGNPGLTFPAKSQRQKVSFEAEYIAGTNVDPGFSWLKNDYETVREHY